MRGVSRCGKTKQGKHDANFSRYYNEVGRFQILDAETELKLFLKYQKDGDLDARDRLLGNCLRFVVKLASKFTDDPDKLKDLISSGNEGLMYALKRYDPAYNTRFLSYATNWVLLAMRNELSNSELVSVPLWYQKTVRKIRRVKSSVQASEGSQPSEEQICSETDITPAQLRRLKIERFHYTPLEFTRLSTNGTETRVINEEAKTIIEDFLQVLPSKESFVLRAYFGFIADEPWSLKQISNVIGTSSERIRQIKVKALKRLRRYMERGLDVHGETDVRSSS